MNRYLLHVSYIGTAYSGVTMIEPFYKFGDMRTIQGTLERAMSVFKPYRKCEVCCSSRTDARVHALSSKFHVDLENDIERPIDAAVMIEKLNRKLRAIHASIRVLDVEMVDPNVFMAHRNVARRKYLYRIAVKTKKPTIGHQQDDFFPVEEIDRCYILKHSNFDVEKLKKASKMFIGNFDFRTFMRFSTEEKAKAPCYAQRSMESVTVEESKPCVTSINYELAENCFQFYDIRFVAKSFVYRQIRRIVGTLCAVAEGRITERDVYEMLTIPSHSTWNRMQSKNLVDTAPAHGLYFLGVDYKPLEEMSLDKIVETPRGVRVNSIVSYGRNDKYLF